MEYVAEDSSKFHLVTSPPIPAQCIACSRHHKEGEEWLDFGVNFDYYGAVLFCNYCAAEVARVLGYLPVAQFNDLHETNEAIRYELFEVRNLLEEERTNVRVLSRLLGTDSNNVEPDPPGDVDDNVLPDESGTKLFKTTK